MSTPDAQEHYPYLATLIEQGATLEEVLQFLQDRDYYMIPSIKAVRYLYRVSLREAKQLVHTSQTWSDERPTLDAFHDSIEQSFLNPNRERNEES
jgi:DNA phosphorothioation-dependent restriction protein DptG